MSRAAGMSATSGICFGVRKSRFTAIKLAVKPARAAPCGSAEPLADEIADAMSVRHQFRDEREARIDVTGRRHAGPHQMHETLPTDPPSISGPPALPPRMCDSEPNRCLRPRRTAIGSPIAVRTYLYAILNGRGRYGGGEKARSSS